jgi:hypothetical protein
VLQYLLCLAPDVEVGVYEHHDSPDGAARLEEQDPRAVKEEEHGEAELHAVPKRADVVDPVVQRLPQPVLKRIFFYTSVLQVCSIPKKVLKKNK